VLTEWTPHTYIWCNVSTEAPPMLLTRTQERWHQCTRGSIRYRSLWSECCRWLSFGARIHSR